MLAAGSSKRFGADKRLAKMEDGRSVLEASVASVQTTRLPLLVCLRPGDDIAQQLLKQLAVSFVCCDRAAEGLGATLAQGMAALPNWEGVLVALADMPWIAPATYVDVADTLTPTHICRPVYQGEAGHPVGFGSAFFQQLRDLSGDRGAKAVVAANADKMLSINVSDPGIHQDIDHPRDMVTR